MTYLESKHIIQFYPNFYPQVIVPLTRCGVHTNEGPHPSCQRVRLFHKRPPDGPQWSSVTPEKKLGCYENDIPQHKASLFSWWAVKLPPSSTAA